MNNSPFAAFYASETRPGEFGSYDGGNWRGGSSPGRGVQPGLSANSFAIIRQPH